MNPETIIGILLTVIGSLLAAVYNDVRKIMKDVQQLMIDNAAKNEQIENLERRMDNVESKKFTCNAHQ